MRRHPARIETEIIPLTLTLSLQGREDISNIFLSLDGRELG
jgi:hypothetical protein